MPLTFSFTWLRCRQEQNDLHDRPLQDIRWAFLASFWAYLTNACTPSSMSGMQVYVRDIDRKKKNISLSIKEPEASGPSTQVAKSSSGSARKRNSDTAGMSSLGSMLAMAGFKSKAQLEKEEEKKNAAASSNGEWMNRAFQAHVF